MKKYSSMNAMWSGACRDLDREGAKHSSRAGDTVEIVGWSACLENTDMNLLVDDTRKLDPVYACAELLWYLSGERDVKRMCAYAPSYKRFANPPTEDGVAMGAYGHRWTSNPGFERGRAFVDDAKGVNLKDQLEAAAYLLEIRPETRQAVVTMWDSEDVCEAIVGDANDLPCTLSMQFIRRKTYLHCSVSMRSNDVWLGMPYDVFCFTTIQRMIARRLGLRAGNYVHNVGSLHAYVRDFDKGLDLAVIGRWPGEGWAHQYREDDFRPSVTRAWDVSEALELERRVRAGEWPASGAGGFSPGGPLGDAAAVCVAGLVKRRTDDPAILHDEVSPALRQAWKLKYGQ